MTTKGKRRRNRMPSKLMATTAYSDSRIGVFESSEDDAHQLKTVSQLNKWLDAREPSKRGGLDIRGRVVAELGVFKDQRGEFDGESLQAISDLGNQAPKGLKSNFKHPTMSDDGLGKLLGRDTGFQLDASESKVRSQHFVLSSVAMKPPPEGGGTPYGEYIAELAISDPQAFSSSLVLNYKPEYRYDDDGERQREPDGQLKPAIWRPTRLWAIDCVSVGDAVDDFLSMDELSENDQVIRQANLLITQFFDMDEITPEALTTRLNGFTEKLVAFHFDDFDSHESLEQEETKMDDQNKTKPTPSSNQELLAAQNKTNELLGKLIEGNSVSAIKEPEQAVTTAELSESGIAKKISALCQSQGHPELIAGFLAADPSSTIDGVKDALLKLSAKDRAMDDNSDGDQSALGTGGTVGTKELTPEQKLEAEWETDKEVLQNFGHTKEGWLAERKEEIGIIATLLIAMVGYLVFSSGISSIELASIIGSIGLVGMAVSTNQLYGFDGKHRRARRKAAASANLYDGTLTFIDSSGFSVDTTSSGANTFGGMAVDHADNSAGANGEVEFEVVDEGKIRLDRVTHSLTQADVGKSIYASDNYTITTTSTNNSLIGTLSDVTDLNQPIVYVSY